MRKFINDPATVVTDYLIGLAAAHADIIRYDTDNRFIVRAAAPVTGKVAVMSGGGSGCEPLHTGFVGPGMLDAACPGQIYTSPVPNQLMAATRAIDGGGGLLHIIKNFSGEIMNFGMAEEILALEDVPVESAVVNDDASIEEVEGSLGRRGLGGTLMVEKLAGAAAERGHDLAAVKAVAERVNRRVRSFNIGLSSCTPPARGKPVYDLPDGEMDLGIGISGEPGQERVPLRPAREVAELLVDRVVSDLAPAKGARLLVLINGMGSTPFGELYLLNGEVDRALRQRGFTPARELVGSYVTALDQLGAGLTLLELDDELTELWDAPVHTAALRWGM